MRPHFGGATSVPTFKTCPYCKSRIPGSASVCRHCGREVTALLNALQRIEQLERRELSDLKKTNPSKPQQVASTRVLRITIAFLYTASVLVYHLQPSLYWIATIILALMVGIAIGFFHRSINLWTIFLVGFIQPLILVCILVVTRIKPEFVHQVLSTLFVEGLKVGFIASLGGVVGVFTSGARIEKSQFAINALYDSISAIDTGLERFETIILRLLAVIAAITSLLVLILGK